MPITPRQQEARKSKIGSSDSPAICGLSPYRNALNVYLDKVHERADQNADPIHILMGNYFEPGLLRLAADDLGVEIIQNQSRVSHANKLFGANHDALVKGKPEGIEAKVALQQNDEWGEIGTDQVPMNVFVQCQHQMFVSQLDKVWVTALVQGKFRADWRIYEIPREDQVIKAIVEKGELFWNDHVLPKIPPEDMVVDPQVYRRLVREPRSVQAVAADIITDWRAIKDAELSIVKARKAAEARLLGAMGSAEATEVIAKVGRVTFYETKRKGYTVEPTTYRQLRLENMKKLEANKKAKTLLK